jgi:hypothetical protein
MGRPEKIQINSYPNAGKLKDYDVMECLPNKPSLLYESLNWKKNFNVTLNLYLQNLHGSPKKIQIYPTQQNYPVQAFQGSSTHTMSQVSASPVPSTRTSHHSHTVVRNFMYIKCNNSLTSLET